MAFYKSNRLHFKDSRHSRDSIGSRGRKGVHGHQLQIRGTSRLWRFQGFHRFLQVFRASRRFLLKFFGSSSFFLFFFLAVSRVFEDFQGSEFLQILTILRMLDIARRRQEVPFQWPARRHKRLRDSEDSRDSRDSRGSRDSGDSRDSRDSRDSGDSRDSKDSRDSRDSRGSRDSRTWQP